MSADVYLDSNQSELWMLAPGFDDLLLTGWTIEADTGARYRISARASTSQGGVDALSWGSAQPIDVAVARWMTDGAVTTTQGEDDRTITFPLRLSATTSQALGDAEKALQLRAEMPVLLKWVPPEGAPDAPAAIFEVWTWHLTPTFFLDDEMRLSRLFSLVGTAKPWARDENLTIVEAVTTAFTPTTTEVDTCAAVAGWTGNTAVSSSGGAVKVTQTKPISGHGTSVILAMQRAGVVDMTSRPYLRLDMGVTGGVASSFNAAVDGLALVRAGQVGSVSWWAMPVGKTSFAQLTVNAFVNVKAAAATFAIADVSKSNAVAAVGSARQTVRHLDVGGSVETAGSIQIAAPDGVTDLGWILAVTYPDNLSGYSPPLRQYRLSGGTPVPDTTAVSGFRDTLITAGASTGVIGYQMAPQNLPEASYVVCARMKSSVANNPVALDILAGAPNGLGNIVLPETTTILTTANAWQMCVLTELTLPALRLPAESTLPVSFFLSAASGSGNVWLDEAYLIDVTHGDYSLFDAAFPYAWLDAPDVDAARNRKAIYLGTAADKSDAGAAPMGLILNPGDHRLDARGSSLLVVTDNVDSPVVSASLYRRWNTHPGT